MKTLNRVTLKRALAVGISLAGIAAGYQVFAADEAKPAATEQPTSLRISPSQYRQSITDIFGSSIAITGRFEPETRDEGLMAVGARTANVSDSGLERYDDLARGIALQVVDERHRATLISCKPANAKAADEACARKFITETGRLLYRRPLKEDEIQNQIKVAGDSADKVHDFYAGLSTSLSTMLVSPNFLFRYKVVEADPAHAGQKRMDSLTKAHQLSFLLWNAGPDDKLIEAAVKGELQNKAGLQRQVDRMVSSPRLEAGVRAFFSDMLTFSDFEVMSKDPAFFPRYTLKVKDESQEQTLRTIVDHVVKRQGDYRDLFTTRNTFLTRSLAALYDVPLVETTDNGQPMHWQPYTYGENDPRAGILAQASFVALHSPAGRTSPTGRGKALREAILCQMVPPPPGNVDFKFVQDTTNPVYKTTRDRLTAHRSEAMCAGCHKITDPIGLALENFDSSGGFRTTENGVQIDTTGDLSGVKFDGPIGLSKAIHDDPATVACVAKRAFAFGAGRSPTTNSDDWKQIERGFKDSNYNFVTLLRQIALSDMFYAVPTQTVAAK